MEDKMPNPKDFLDDEHTYVSGILENESLEILKKYKAGIHGWVVV